MKLKEDIKPISYIKTHAAAILKKINETHRPVIITQNGEAKGVFIDTESYEEMKNTLAFLKMAALSEKQIDEGKIIPQEEVFKQIEKKLNI